MHADCVSTRTASALEIMMSKSVHLRPTDALMSPDKGGATQADGYSELVPTQPRPKLTLEKAWNQASEPGDAEARSHFK